MHKNWKFMHASIVVKDIEKAIRHFETLDIGPFPPFLGGPGMAFSGKTVKGKKVDYDMDLRLAKSDFGGIGLELIQPLKGESLYSEFLAKHGEGLHHLAYGVEDFDAEKADMEKRGFKVVQTGAIGDIRFAYFNTDTVGGMLIELCETPKKKA
jgi:methylmalonyl-CoA/ethylmalonyl-CoA epimerase